MDKVVVQDLSLFKKKKITNLIILFCLVLGLSFMFLSSNLNSIIISHECAFFASVSCPENFDTLEIYSTILRDVGLLSTAASVIVAIVSAQNRRKRFIDFQKKQSNEHNLNIPIVDSKGEQKGLSSTLFFIGLVFTFLAAANYYTWEELYFTVCSIGFIFQILCIGTLFNNKLRAKDAILITFSILILVASGYGMYEYLFYY